MKQCPFWKSLKKVINYSENILEIDHDASALQDDSLPYLNMNESELKDLFKENSIAQATTMIERIVEKDAALGDKRQDLVDLTKPRDSQKLKSSESFQEKEKECEVIKASKTKTDSGEIVVQRGAETKEKRKLMVENIHDQIEELKRKKVILSELDATGIVLRKVVDTIDTMYDFIREKYRITHSSSYKVPIDKTFKVKEKVFQFNLFIASMKLTLLINFFQNQIFIEGLLELPLDKYKNALRLAKPNAPAIGYQIIKTAFPESYYKNVTLGKKSYKNEQLHSYKFVTNGGENSTSVPLAFVFAFADPFSKPYEGEIDPELGQSRINSFQGK